MKIGSISAIGIIALSSCTDQGRAPASPQLEAANEGWSAHADYGGTPSQSFAIGHAGEIATVDLALSGRENPRELLVLVRRADENGYPDGDVLASGVASIAPLPSKEVGWHVIPMNERSQVLEPGIYTITCVPSKPVGGYGYFEYGYSGGNKYADGRLHSRDHGRQIPQDDGRDLAFRVFLRPSTKADKSA